MVEIFRKGTKKHSMKLLSPLMNDNKGEIRAIIVIVLAIVIGAILTGAIGPSSLANIVNATNAGQVLASAPSQVTSTWNTIPVMYSIAFFLIPIAAIVKYIDM